MTDERGNSSDIRALPPDLPAVIKSIEVVLKRVPEGSLPHRRLDAVLQVSRGELLEKVTESTGFSRRSIQRWRAKVRDKGPQGVAAAPSRGRPTRLSARQLARLADDLKLPPHRFGLPGPHWTGGQLAEHLTRRYGITMGVRQCRNLVCQLGASRAPATSLSLPERRSEAWSNQASAPRPARFSGSAALSDWERKRRALLKIQRLASSGLPLLPFAYTLFDLSAEAVDQLDFHRIGERFGVWLCKNFDFAKWSGIYKQAVMDTAGRSGFVALNTFYKSAKPTAGFFVPAGGKRPDFVSDQFFLPDFMRSSAWNEFFRPAGIDGVLLNVLRDRDETVGLYPMHRDGRMRPWGNTDIDFLRATVPHIAHGLKNARQVAYSWNDSDGVSLFAKTSPAVILMTLHGRVMALNDRARSIFEQIGVFDQMPIDAFGAQPVKAGLEYVACILRSIFFGREEPSFELSSPVARVYAHASGMVLKLRGFLVNGDREQRYFTVIIEQGESEEHRLQRLMYRHGLSRREAELLLRLRTAPPTSHEIAAAMGISGETLRTYFKRIAEKLDLHGRAELARRILAEN